MMCMLDCFVADSFIRDEHKMREANAIPGLLSWLI